MKGLTKAVNELKNRRVIVVGDILLDGYHRGNVERLNPENPAVALVKVTETDYFLGGAANVARNLSSIGASVYLLGRVGEDDYGKKIQRLCEKESIKTYFVDRKTETITKLRVASDGEYLVRADIGENSLRSLSGRGERDLERAILNDINVYDLVIFSDYNKGIFWGNLAGRVIQEARRNKVLTLVDPKPANIGRITGCDIVRPNRKEAEEISGTSYNGRNIGEIANRLSDRSESRYSVITCGGDGAFYYDSQTGEGEMVPAIKRDFGDATGAGDTFAAILGLGMASRLGIKDSTKLANLAAGIVVGKKGTAALTLEELKHELSV